MAVSPIPPETHPSVEQFFSVVTKRLTMYHEAIDGARRGLGVNMTVAAFQNMERFKQLNHQYNFFGRGPWGYGINQISDGKQEINLLDVQDFEKVPGLNKHHNVNAQLALLIPIVII